MSALADAAKVIRDAFHYDPGHADLDDDQPIAIHVTLGDWRRLNRALATDLAQQESVPADAIPMPKAWIEEAKCPNCGGVGWRAIQVEAGVFEQDQCQWCFEQWLALGQPSPNQVQA